MTRRLLRSTLALVLASACYIDFREGLRCETNADCQGLVCVAGRCEDAANSSSSSDGSLTASVYRITGDSNGDASLSPGETGGMILQLLNSGSKLTGVTGTLTTSLSGVTITNGETIKFGDIASYSSECGNLTYPGDCSSTAQSYPKVALTTAIDPGTQIPFTLALKDSSGNSLGSLPLSIVVDGIGTSLTADVYRITGDSNGDASLSPGESGGVIVRILNSDSKVLGVTGSLSTTASGVSIANGENIKFGDIAAYSSACGNLTYPGDCSSTSLSYPKISLTTSVAPGTQIPFKLSVRDSLGNTYADLPCSLTVDGNGTSLTADVYRITGDSNGDATLSPGENGGLIVRILNSDSKVLGVTGSLSTTASGVTIANGTHLKFGDIAAYSSECGNLTYPGDCSSTSSSYPKISLTTAVAPGTVIPFKLTTSDSLGNALGVLSLSLTVGNIAQSLTASAYRVVGDTNSNGKLGPSETGYLVAQILNSNGSKALGVTGTLSTTTSGVTIVNGTNLKFGDIAGYSTECGNLTYPGDCSSTSSSYPKVTLGSSVAAGTVIQFQLTLTDSLGNALGSLPFSLTAG